MSCWFMKMEMATISSSQQQLAEGYLQGLQAPVQKVYVKELIFIQYVKVQHVLETNKPMTS